MVDDHGPDDALYAPHIVRPVDAAFVQELVVSATPENQRLEYKRAVPTSWSDKHSSELRKDVVAMANGGGGIIVYGIEENKNGQAAGLHTIPDHDTACTRMESVLAACIDPPLHRISIEPLAVQEKTVLVVQVEQHEVLPHCVENGAEVRRFPVRQGRLVRAMTMQEIRHRIQGDRTARELAQLRNMIERLLENRGLPSTSVVGAEVRDNLASASEFAAETRSQFLKKHFNGPTLWIAIVPNPVPDSQPILAYETEAKRLLSNPPRARRSGWFIEAGSPAKVESLGLTVHDQYRQMSLTLCWNGAILYAAALDSVSATWAYDNVVNPHALVDPMVCVFAMARKVSTWLPESVVAHVNVGLYNAASTRITPFHTQSYAMIFGHHNSVMSVENDALEVVIPNNRAYTALGDEAALAVVQRMFEQVGFTDPDLKNIPGFDEHGKYVLS